MDTASVLRWIAGSAQGVVMASVAALGVSSLMPKA